MRIIAGNRRGTKLLSPKTNLSRPITDRVKESLFSVLYKYDLPQGSFVADFFSGVGSLGLEALSRQADFVTFVEKDPKTVAILKKNIEKCGFDKNCRIIQADAFKFTAPVDERKYDLVFVDPPYPATKNVGRDSRLAGLLEILSEQLTDEGFAVVRTEKKTVLLESYGRLKVIERRQWGTMAVTILQRSGA